MATLVQSTLGVCMVYKFLGDWLFNNDHETAPYTGCGYYSADWNHIGGGMEVPNVTIPKGSTIDVAYLILEAYESGEENFVRSKIVGEATDNAASFSDLADYQARRGTEVGGANNDNRTVAEVLWDNIGTWETGVDYNSPDIKTVIQEIVDRDGWSSGNRMGVWWDDHAGRSTTLHDWTIRFAALNPKIHIEYTPPTVEKYFAWII